MRLTLKRLARLTVIVLAVIGAGALAGGLMLASKGIGARSEPGAVETAVARRLRSVAIPHAARTLTDPNPMTSEFLETGLSHFAGHCAVCHANDGSGQTELGRGLYPRAPDMRGAATQTLTDGELFYIIENGVKLTGMPAWGNGTPEGETASWHLVGFIRHLPLLTAEELERMKALNPKAPGDEIDPEEFLKGADAPASEAPKHKHQGGRND